MPIHYAEFRAIVDQMGAEIRACLKAGDRKGAERIKLARRFVVDNVDREPLDYAHLLNT